MQHWTIHVCSCWFLYHFTTLKGFKFEYLLPDILNNCLRIWCFPISDCQEFVLKAKITSFIIGLYLYQFLTLKVTLLERHSLNDKRILLQYLYKVDPAAKVLRCYNGRFRVNNIETGNYNYSQQDSKMLSYRFVYVCVRLDVFALKVKIVL